MLENPMGKVMMSVTGRADLTELDQRQVRVWGVFLLCLLSSALGVVLSFFLLGSVVRGYRLWGFGLVIAITMLGISYGAKYANADSRAKFTPVDMIQYITQGFLWPSTWPALADLLGIEKIAPPTDGASLLDEILRIVLSV